MGVFFGNYDFNKHPLAPPGTKVIIHSKPDQRKSSEFHGEEGFYVDPATNHYGCVHCFVPKTQKEQIIDTVAFVPNVTPIPNTTIYDHLHRTADDLIHLLTKKPNLVSPTGVASPQSALLRIAKLLHTDASPIIAPLPLTPTKPKLTFTMT